MFCDKHMKKKHAFFLTYYSYYNAFLNKIIIYVFYNPATVSSPSPVTLILNSLINKKNAGARY